MILPAMKLASVIILNNKFIFFSFLLILQKNQKFTSVPSVKYSGCQAEERGS